MPRLLTRLSRHLRGFSHQQSLVRLRDAFNFVPTVVYDIGAYHGDWTKATRKVFPAAEYFLFEANPENALILRASGESHFIAALAEKEGMQMKFHLPGDESPATGASLYREKEHSLSAREFPRSGGDHAPSRHTRPGASAPEP